MAQDLEGRVVSAMAGMASSSVGSTAEAATTSPNRTAPKAGQEGPNRCIACVQIVQQRAITPQTTLLDEHLVYTGV